VLGTYISESEKETLALGESFAAQLHGGEIVALRGELGSGKTVFVKGVCRGLGSTDVVSSPTFVLINEYNGNRKIYHADLYRLETEAQLPALGLEELPSPDAVLFIEWPDIASKTLRYRFLVQCEQTGNMTRKFHIEERK